MWDQQTTGAREPPPKSPQKATKTANKGQSSYTEACIYLEKPLNSIFHYYNRKKFLRAP